MNLHHCTDISVTHPQYEYRHRCPEQRTRIQKPIRMGRQVYDPTGQTSPLRIEPDVTTTPWPDEGIVCYAVVVVGGMSVPRREDSCMINGTRLLQTPGMFLNDDILKSEKVKHVVESGPMLFQGVWIPFERALELANQEGMTDLLYPLFVYDIAALLPHPGTQMYTVPSLSTGSTSTDISHDYIPPPEDTSSYSFYKSGCSQG